MGVWVGVAVVVVVGIVWIMRNSANESGAGQQTLIKQGAAPEAVAPSGAMPAPPPAGPGISGTIAFSAANPSPKGGVIFLMARPASAPSAAPVAVVRLSIPASGADSPIPFNLTNANSMGMGGSLAQPVVLDARWDEDGDPMTKTPGDLLGKFEGKPVTEGAKGVRIVLDTLRKNAPAAPTPVAGSQPNPPDKGEATRPDPPKGKAPAAPAGGPPKTPAP